MQNGQSVFFSVSPQSRSLFSATFQTFCLTARAYLNTENYGLFCSLNRAKPRRPSMSVFSAIFVLKENGTQSHSARFLNWGDHVNSVPDLAASPPWFLLNKQSITAIENLRYEIYFRFSSNSNIQNFFTSYRDRLLNTKL